jgi:hypothetical protein
MLKISNCSPSFSHSMERWKSPRQPLHKKANRSIWSRSKNNARNNRPRAVIGLVAKGIKGESETN